MILPDVNVLLYAFREDAAQHAASRVWLSSVIDGNAAYGMCPQVLASLVRIATNARIYARPDRFEAALSFCKLLLDQPHCQIIRPGPRHWEIYCDLCRQVNATGNLTQDAWLAAIAIESGCEWITTDRDYAKFPGLRWRTPF